LSYRRRAGGGKRDLVEPDIVAALEAYGVRVWRLGGQGNPDLLCLYRARYTPLEVKTGTNKPNANQQTIPWAVVRSVEEALAAVRSPEIPRVLNVRNARFP
jgi:hypothetical protein